jgi:hypothetical protein
MSEAGPRGRLLAAIFDVDGVLVASPRERAWRESLAGYADPARFTTAFYQAHVAGKLRLDGARATLERLGVPDAAAHAPEYARKKQALIDRLIAGGSFEAFPDAVRFASTLHAAGLRLALGLLIEERRSHAAPSERARRTTICRPHPRGIHQGRSHDVCAACRLPRPATPSHRRQPGPGHPRSCRNAPRSRGDRVQAPARPLTASARRYPPCNSQSHRDQPSLADYAF